MENADLESCLREIKAISIKAKDFFINNKFKESLQERLKEVALLKNAYDSTPKSDKKSGKIAGDLGESYSSVAKIWHKLNNDKEDVEYLRKSRDIFKTTFDDGRLPAFAYSTYLFVIHRLLEKAAAPEEKLLYAREYAWVLVKVTNKNLYLDYKGENKPARELLRPAIAKVAELEKQIRDAKQLIPAKN